MKIQQKSNTQQSFGSFKLYKTLSIPRAEVEYISSTQFTASSFLGILKQTKTVLEEERNIAKSLKPKKNMFVFGKERSSEEGVFDFYVADAEEGKLLNSIENAGLQVEKFYGESIGYRSEVYVMKTKIAETLKKTKDILIEKLNGNVAK